MKKILSGLTLGLGLISFGLPAYAQTGVSEDRVSLPEGPGSLEGVGDNVGVNTNMGGMTYSVDIEVPTGFDGLTPSLGLSYNSNGGESVVGVGWSMDMPSIERMTYRKLPQYTENDDFCMGGSEQLIRLGESNVYRARYEGGFMRYTWMEMGDGGQGYWIAEMPDGSRSYFGATADGQLVPEARVGNAEGTFRYMLVDKVDVHGHKMTWTYQKFGNYALPTHIGYVFKESGPTYEVELDYEDREDPTKVAYISDATPGFNLLLTQRLQEVRIKSRQQTIRTYNLNYESYDTAGGFTRLTRVEKRGAEGNLYPIVFDFEYSQALGAMCEDDCQEPYITNMGSLGVNVANGRATLIDINGDALPDVVDASQDGPHRFFLNIARDNGTSFFNEQSIASAVAERDGFELEAGTVQTLDVNGDGFTDLANTATGSVLMNNGSGDWLPPESITSDNLAAALNEDFNAAEGGLQAMRFIDFNNDKKIDVMRATRAETLFYENKGDQGFEIVDNVTALNAGFEEDNLQLSDMNGDGLLDLVKVQLGSIRYRLNYGWGKWGDWVDITGLPIGDGDLEIAELEDINGDGLSDLVVVKGRSVTYALNNNTTSFAAPVQIVDEEVNGTIPLRDPSVTVLYADMNANGSSDVVWISSQGEVSTLELFPVRPNLMTRITNAIGMVTDVSYGTVAQEMARDGGWQEWQYKIPYPMNVVKETDKYDLLTDLHEINRYDYHDGFYDGAEKQFRGFERVETRLQGDETLEEGLTREIFNVGSEDPYFHGKLVRSSIASAGRELLETINTFDDCPVAELDGETELPIRHICETASETITKEGLPEDRWIKTVTSSEYDGYGNITLSIDSGITEIGGGACAPCGDRDDNDFGQPCGNQCLGDEQYTRTEYVPTENTNGRWILNAPYREVTYGRPDSPLQSETLTYYDGNDFEGLPLGNLNKGLATRITEKVETGSDRVIETERNKYDAHGNILEILDALGEADGNDHRRVYTYDAENLRVTRAELLLEDKDGQPYRLRRDVTFEPLFDKPFEATDWLLVRNGSPISPIRGFAYEYDEHGRLTSRFLQGNNGSAPDETYEYILESPASRIITRKRSTVGEDFDLEATKCIDGRGREFQTRTRLNQGSYLVSGLTRYNLRSRPVEEFQPYTSTSNTCDMTPPAGTLSTTHKYDASHRLIETVMPDEGIYEGASVKTIVYEPFAMLDFDAEDNDPNSPHFNTPLVTRKNGMDQVVAYQRTFAGGDTGTTQLHYDPLGRLIGYTDDAGNRKEQYYDLLSRVTRVVDPNSANDTTYTYDDAGNVTRQTDDRGITTVMTYDGLNRNIAKWDDADPEGTRIERNFDFDNDCPQCTLAEGRLASVTYPGPNGTTAKDSSGYDLRTRPTYKARTLLGHTFASTIAYDNADRVTSTTYPDGTTLEQTHDDASRLTAIPGLVPSITYDPRSLADSMSHADSTTTTIAYDDLMRAVELKTNLDGETLQGLKYTYDRQSNLEEIEDLAQGSTRFNTNYTHDAWYRVTSTDFDQERIDFAFNKIDNLTSITSSTGDQSKAHVGPLSYDSYAPNAVTEVAGTTFDYDASGNMNQRGDTAFTWDYMHRLTSATSNGQTSTFTYGPDQVRVTKQEGPSTVLYTSLDFEVRDGISSLYVMVEGKRVARIENDALATSLYNDHNEDNIINAADALEDDNAEGILLSSVRRLLMETGPDQNTTFLHRDYLGSITLATGTIDGESQIIGQRTFYPLGQERPGSTGYVDEYGFTGQEVDRSTGLLHFEWRYYDPQVGRWLSIDPSFGTTTNNNISKHGEATTAYNYVAGNFSTSIDPTGLGKNGVSKFLSKVFGGGKSKSSKKSSKVKKSKSQKKIDKKVKKLAKQSQKKREKRNKKERKERIKRENKEINDIINNTEGDPYGTDDFYHDDSREAYEARHGLNGTDWGNLGVKSQPNQDNSLFLDTGDNFSSTPRVPSPSPSPVVQSSSPVNYGFVGSPTPQGPPTGETSSNGSNIKVFVIKYGYD